MRPIFIFKMNLPGQIKNALIDIDDTLIPWEKPHAKAYPAMSYALSLESGIAERQIIESIRAVNTKHGTIEYTALVQEMPCFDEFSLKKKLGLIDVAQSSRYAAMEDLNLHSPEIDVLLDTLLFNHLALTAISDAPINLAYLRLKKADLLKKLHRLIAMPSPDDSNFPPEKRMGNKPYLIDTVVSQKAKPNTDLEKVLEMDAATISKTHFIIGNSHHSDVGLAKRAGLLIYVPNWYKSTPEERATLQLYAPEKVLARNIGTQSPEEIAIKAAPGFEMVPVNTVQELLADLRKRFIIE